MTEIKVIFDGKTFVPQEPIALPEKTEAKVVLQRTPEEEAAIDAEIAAYYQSGGEDEDDESWAKGLAADARLAWDEED